MATKQYSFNTRLYGGLVFNNNNNNNKNNKIIIIIIIIPRGERREPRSGVKYIYLDIYIYSYRQFTVIFVVQ